MFASWIPRWLKDSCHKRAATGGARFYKPLLEALEDRAVPSRVTWDGENQFSNRWSEARNWRDESGHDVVPVAGDDLIFPVNAARKTNVNNLASTTFRSLRFDGSGYIISAGTGNVISLGDGIFNTATSGTNSYNGPIQVDQPSVLPVALRVDVDDGGSLQLGGVISGTGGLDKVDMGVLTLTGPDANAFTGATHVFGGRLVLDKGDATGPRLAIRSRTLAITSTTGHATTVRLLRDNQIADNATVSATMVSQGVGGSLDLNGFSDAIGDLHLTGGVVQVPSTSVLTLNGDVNAQGFFGNFNQSSLIIGDGTLALGINPRTFTVTEAPGFSRNGTDFAINLAISASISGSVLIKEGIGAMQVTDCAARIEVNAGSVLRRATLDTALSSVILRNDGQFGGHGDVTGSVSTRGGSAQTVDNGSSGFTAVGWTSQSTPLGFGSDIAVSPTSPGAALWTLSGLTPGLYRVFATWPFNPNNANFNSSHSTSAPYSIFDDTTLLTTAVVNQELAPAGGPRNGDIVFQQLAGAVNITSGTIKVQLSNRVSPEQDGQSVVADAVRIERLSGTLKPGILNDTVDTHAILHLGSASLGNGSTYRVHFTSNDVHNNASALNVDGSFLNSGALLELSAEATFPLDVNFTAPDPGTAYTIITTGTSAGSFSNAPSNGDPIDLFANGQRHRFTINYDAGDGNDVELIYQSTATQVRDLRISPEVIDEGDRVTLRGALTDPNKGDVLSLRVDWGDGTVQTFRDLGTNPFHFTHTYADNLPDGLPYLVRVEWFDQHGLGKSAKLFVTVNNVPPRLFLGSAEVIRAGDTMYHTATFIDPGADTWTATVDYGDGSGPQTLAVRPDGHLLFEHRYKKPGAYRVTVTVLDDDGGLSTDTFLVIVLPSL